MQNSLGHESAGGRLTARGEYVVFYDARCGLCRWSRRMIERLGAGVPMRWIDVHDRGELMHWSAIDPEATQHQVFVLDPEGRLHGGYAAAVTLLAATTSVVRVLRPVLLSGPMRLIGGKAYHWVSQNRHWLSRWLGLK